LARITDKDQSGREGMGAAQGDLQQAAIEHRSLVDQHQSQ
jgi:hypothetical protein